MQDTQELKTLPARSLRERAAAAKRAPLSEADFDDHESRSGFVEELRGMEDRLDWLENQGRR